MSENISDFKKKLRKEMKKTLEEFHKNLSEEEKVRMSEKICMKVTAIEEYKNADLILAYIPDRLEADCRPLILDALKEGKKVAIPKVDFAALKEGRSRMDFYFLDGRKSLEEQLESGAYGILEPKGGLEKLIWGVAGRERPVRGKNCETVFERVSVKDVPEPLPFVIVPGVAFTKDGKRLGHGKGFYDIYIEEMQQHGAKPFLCGFCLPCQIVEEIPIDEHDVRMDCVISQEGQFTLLF